MSGALGASAREQPPGPRREVGSFFRALLLGDFEDNPNTAATIVGGLLSLVPVLDQVMDARDITACLYKINNQGGFKNATPEQLVNLGFAGIGAIPEIGSAFKTVFQPLWRERHLAKGAVNGGVQAIEALLGMKKGGAIRWIRTELIDKWGARTQQAIAVVDQAFDACIALTEFMANAGGWKGWLIPHSVQVQAAGTLPGLQTMRSDFHGAMNLASAEILAFLMDLLGEQAAAIATAALEAAIASSANPGTRSRRTAKKPEHNAADKKTKGKEEPRQGRKKTGDKDTANTDKGAGASHNGTQRTRGMFEKMANMEKGLIGEHMVDYSELQRLGGSFVHDISQPFPGAATTAKINVDKRPVNLSIVDMRKVPQKGLDSVWIHPQREAEPKEVLVPGHPMQRRRGYQHTVTEAKMRTNLYALGEAAKKQKIPEVLKGDDRLLYALLSTSKAVEGDGKPLVQMSHRWVASRASHEGLASSAHKLLEDDDHCCPVKS